MLTATGRKDWTTQAIQRILQNEKYMGDVLLQKTFTANFLEGRPRKNNGELPKYYIENNHPAIVSREVFHRVQEEIARRKSKYPAAKKHTKTNRGKFTSKYALSERLVCGDCGSAYRRVTWSIHGSGRLSGGASTGSRMDRRCARIPPASRKKHYTAQYGKQFNP